MPYSNTWKLAQGANVTINSTTYLDPISISGFGDTADLIETTTLGSTRKEYATGLVDSEEIEIVLALTGTPPAITTSAVTCSVALPTITKTAGFSAQVISAVTQPIETGGKLGVVVRLKPTTTITYT